MKTPSKVPATLVEAIRYFSDPDVCLAFLVGLRWPNGVRCVNCASELVSFLATRRVWKCRGCKKQFSVKVGTIFEDSPLGLDKWLAALWMIVNCKNGISSYEIARALGVTQKSAWFMLHRIRLATQIGGFDAMKGEVEADETWVGGKAGNRRHRLARLRSGLKSGAPRQRRMAMTAVMGLLERGPDGTSRVRTRVVPNVRRASLAPEIREHVEKGAKVYTDSLQSYRGLGSDYVHEVVNHAETYASGRIHVNGLENFWSLLKRALRGTYVSVEPYHLFRYLDEQVFRYNARKSSDAVRFATTLANIVGRRLTWKVLTADGAVPA